MSNNKGVLTTIAFMKNACAGRDRDVNLRVQDERNACAGRDLYISILIDEIVARDVFIYFVTFRENPLASYTGL